MENYGTDPEIEVDNAPQDHAAGRDRQLETALGDGASRKLGATPAVRRDGPRPRLQAAAAAAATARLSGLQNTEARWARAATAARAFFASSGLFSSKGQSFDA